MQTTHNPSISNNKALLGLIKTDLSDAQKAKIREISNFDFTRVRARMQVDFPTPDAELDRVELEVKRFLALAACDKTLQVVSEKIDQLWHYFVLSTQEYSRFCKRIYGAYLHHIPILPSEKQSIAQGYNETRNTYKLYFGAPPQDLWGNNAQICYSGDEGDYDGVSN